MGIGDLVILEAYRRGYRVESDGQIRSPSGSIIRGYEDHTHSKPYVLIAIRCHGRMYKFRAHRLAAYQKFSNTIFESGTIVRHYNDDSLDNSLDNIVIGTRKDNHNDAVRNGTKKQRKLSDKEVRIARAKYAQGESGTQLAKRFGISKSVMYRILNGERYKDV